MEAAPVRVYLTWSEWIDTVPDSTYHFCVRVLRDSSSVGWDLYRLTCVEAFWTPPWHWVLKCANATLENSMKSRWLSPGHTRPLTESTRFVGQYPNLYGFWYPKFRFTRKSGCPVLLRTQTHTLTQALTSGSNQHLSPKSDQKSTQKIQCGHSIQLFHPQCIYSIEDSEVVRWRQKGLCLLLITTDQDLLSSLIGWW